MKNLDINTFSELLLIVGGFLLAETIVRYFLTLSEGIFPLWVLALVGILIIFESISLKKEGWTFSILYTIYLLIYIILVVLIKREMITSINFVNFVLITFVIILFTFIVDIIYHHKKR